MENICKFVPDYHTSNDLLVLNFIYEKEAFNSDKLHLQSHYSMYLVTDGSGCLHMLHGDYPLEPGSIFFTFSAKPFRIENYGGLQYLYISFIGLRAAELLDRLNINPNAPVYPEYGYLRPFWLEAFETIRFHNIDLLAESVLLRTFSALCERFNGPSQEHQISNTFTRMKKYIDDHYSNSELSLQTVSRIMNYNDKYLSTLFKRNLGVGFADYLRTLRIQRACSLMEQGIATVTDLSYLVGYKDPLYFSRVFTKIMGVSPKEHIREMQSQKQKRKT